MENLDKISEKMQGIDKIRKNKTPLIKKEIIKVIERENNYIPKIYSKIALNTYLSLGDKLLNLIKELPDDIIDIDPFPAFLGYNKSINNLDNYYLKLMKGENTWYDEWGTKMKHKSNSAGSAAVGFPLKSWDEYIKYISSKIPVGTNYNRMALAKDKIYTIDKSEQKYIIGNQVFGIFERAKFLRSTEEFLTDLYTDEKMVRRLLRELTNYNLSMIEEWSHLGIDAVFYGDDWGGQKNMLISPDLWRNIFKPYYEEIGKCIHNNDMHFFFHSCGNITPIIEDLIEVGVDVLHPIQPACNDYEIIASNFSNEITVMGGLDVQKILVKGDKSQIESSIYRFIDTFSRNNCGVILSPTNKIGPDIPFENLKFAFELISKI